MFTGLIEETGTITTIKQSSDSVKLAVTADVTVQGTNIGDSIAVNGCCLTATKVIRRGKSKGYEFNLLRETWNVTNLSMLKCGASVNLERALALGQRMGGHFVTGHVDALGKIRKWEKQGKDWLLNVDVPSALMSGLVLKGSIAVDGISLTVANLRKRSFSVWIIPHTRLNTNFRTRKVGDSVNLETDLLGKYVLRQIEV
ncbi:MAG: riboflavin synthase [Verrucomicrobiota bacterium]|nr:riboflavin synthase [Verrucomicrobiales bacterium]MED5453905.1 riboflavin synthase [Verrucomicrobiota bacterium]